MTRILFLLCAALMVCARGAVAQPGNLFPIAECMSVSDSMIQVRFGYQSLAEQVLNRPVTPTDNIFVGGGISGYVGQPVVFVPGRHRDVFRGSFDLAESPSYSWFLDGRVVSFGADLPLCRDREQRRVIGLLECVQPPSTAHPLATARFAYVNTGDQLDLPSRSSRNYFAGPGGVFGAQQQRGQPTSYLPGVHRAAFTVSFDPLVEPMLVWEIDGEAVPAALDLPNVPLCTPLAQALFADGFEPTV